jgi:hypothetical protein
VATKHIIGGTSAKRRAIGHNEKRSPRNVSSTDEEQNGEELPQSPISDEQRATAETQISEQSKRIEFYITEYSLELLASKMRSGSLVIPAYQRRFVWDDRRKHRFIESLLMGLPVPFLFFWEMKDGRLEVVDGAQRLHTLVQFFDNKLRLGVLDSLSAASGFTFGDLPVSRQRKLHNKSIRGIVLNEHADERARFDMFERINTSSKAANKAEVRRGALAGPFMDVVVRLASDSKLMNLAPLPKQDIKEREHEELVARFFAYGDGLEEYQDRPGDFVYEYAKKMNKRFTEDSSLAAQYEERFERTLKFVAATFPYGFRKSKSGIKTYRSRFEALAIGSWLAIQARPRLERAPRLLAADSWPYDEEFSKIAGADGANAKKRLTTRIEFVRDRLLGAKK